MLACFSVIPRPPVSTLFPYATLVRSRRKLKAVVMTRAVAVAGVLVGTFGSRIAAVGPRGDVVRLASSAAVTRVRVVALTRSVITAGRAIRLEAVVMTRAVAVAGVLVG